MNPFYLIASLTILVNLGESERLLSINKRIFGGYYVKVNDYPYHARVILTERNDLFPDFLNVKDICCGSIVDEKWIVTSGHCGKLIDPEFYKILVGSGKGNINYNETYENIYTIESVVLHPNYKKHKKFDIQNGIGLIKVNKSFRWSKKVKPIKLAKRDENIYLHQLGYITGLGINEFYPSNNLDNLKVAKMKIVDFKYCVNQGFLYNSNELFCGSFKGVNACSGDSGSGFITINNNTKVLRGVLSASGHGCKVKKNAVIVFVSISYHINWIEKIIST